MKKWYAMKKLMIALIALAFVVMFVVPAMAAPRASPIALMGDMMLVPTDMAATHHQVFLALRAVQIQAALDANYFNCGQLIGHPGASALADENTISIFLTDHSRIQARSIGIFPLNFAPVAFCNTMEPAFANMEQRHDAAYNTLNWTTMMSAAPRMENTFTVGVSPVLRL